MDAETRSELAAIDRSIAQLTQGLTAIVGTLEAHTGMLSTIMAAVTEEKPPSELAEALRGFTGTMEKFIGKLDAIGDRFDGLSATMTGLPAKIEESVKRGTVKGLHSAAGGHDMP
jgi:hypothetical protein